MSSVNYFDVHSNNWTVHLMHLEAFLKQIRLHNVTFNLKKCIFGKGEVKFIDHVLGSGRKMMNPDRMTILVNKKIPETISWTKDLQSAFDLLKDRIRSNVVLYVVEIGKPFHLYCDSSDFAVGAVLCQVYALFHFISKKID
jgi:RNase H-like domain found in reverse transcriptase